jgi:hypothetical protein
MEQEAGNMPGWGARELQVMIEYCTTLQQQNTIKHDTRQLSPELGVGIREFKEALEDAREQVEDRTIKLYIGYEEFALTLRQCEDFLKKLQTSPRLEQGRWGRRRSSAADRGKFLVDAQRLADLLHGHQRKLNRYLKLVERQVANETQHHLLLHYGQTGAGAGIQRVQTATSDFAGPSLNYRDDDIQSEFTNWTNMRFSDAGDGEHRKLDAEIRGEVREIIENWLKRSNAADRPSSPKTINDYAVPDCLAENENGDISTPLLNDRAFTFGSAQTTPENAYAISELFPRSSVISLVQGIQIDSIRKTLMLVLAAIRNRH